MALDSSSKLGTSSNSASLQVAGAADSSEELSSTDIMDSSRRHVGIWDGDSSTINNEIFLSLFWAGSKLGAAYYDSESTQVYILPDCEENTDFLMTKKVLMQLEPQKIIVSSKQDDRLYNFLQKEGRSESMQLLPSIDYSVEMSKRRVLSIELPALSSEHSEAERAMYLMSLIPMSSVNMVRALGALLKWLEKFRVGIELDDADAKVPILAIQTLQIEDMMILDGNTYSSLQIFQRENHPSVYKTGLKSSGKEGLSLFGIMNKCKSRLGSQLLRSWFLRPSQSLSVLKDRLDAIRFFVNPRHTEVVSTLHNCLKYIQNITGILKVMQEGQSTPANWQALYKTIYNAAYIADLCRGQSKQVGIFTKIVSTFTEDLSRLATAIVKTIDFEESITAARFIVKSNFDPELDAKKRRFNGLPDFMTLIAKDEMTRLDKSIPMCHVVYIPQIGYLLKIDDTPTLKSQDYQLPGMTFMFVSNGAAHFKTDRTKELDSLLGDSQLEIQDEELDIRLKLQDYILSHTDLLLKVTQYTAELDCLLALASSAQELNLMAPDLTEQSVLHIQRGRHLLQELCCDTFVPNDTKSGVESGKMKVLTGPNSSGKSIYLKQVGLIVFLAHIGSFVPAESAVIGITDRIFTRIRTLESVATGLSTFAIDLNQVSTALKYATEKSLVILDEFGKGTDTVDGMAVLTATLRYWLQQQSQCPHVFVSTHFIRMIQSGLLPQSPQLCLQTMEVLDEGAELVFLYQLIEGVAKCSYARHIAALAGLPQSIIARAAEITNLLSVNQPLNKNVSPQLEDKERKYKAVIRELLSTNLDDQTQFEAFVHFCRSQSFE